MAKLQILLLRICWTMIEVQGQLRSAIQSRMRFMDLYEANFDKMQLSMDVSFQPRYASRVTNKPPEHMYSSVYNTSYLILYLSHHVFFDFQSVDAVLTDCLFSRHFMFRWRQIIPVGLWQHMNLFSIGM